MCLYMGEYTGKVYYYDFTSHYPSEGCNILPYGAPEYFNFTNEEFRVKHQCS